MTAAEWRTVKAAIDLTLRRLRAGYFEDIDTSSAIKQNEAALRRLGPEPDEGTTAA